MGAYAARHAVRNMSMLCQTALVLFGWFEQCYYQKASAPLFYSPGYVLCVIKCLSMIPDAQCTVLWRLIVSHCLPGLLGLKTLVVKMFSVTLSMAGGLIAGKEGPFIHAGGIVGGGIAGMGSRSGWLSPVCHHDKWQHCCTLSSIASWSD